MNANKKIYLAFETDGDLKVIASADEEILKEIFENEPEKGFLQVLTGEDEQVYKKQYVFVPYYKDYNLTYHENEYTVVTLDVDSSSLNLLTKNGLDIGVSVNTIIDPEREQNSSTFYMSDGIAYNAEGEIDARKHRILRMPAG